MYGAVSTAGQGGVTGAVKVCRPSLPHTGPYVFPCVCTADSHRALSTVKDGDPPISPFQAAPACFSRYGLVTFSGHLRERNPLSVSLRLPTLCVSGGRCPCPRVGLAQAGLAGPSVHLLGAVGAVCPRRLLQAELR